MNVSIAPVRIARLLIARFLTARVLTARGTLVPPALATTLAFAAVLFTGCSAQEEAPDATPTPAASGVEADATDGASDPASDGATDRANASAPDPGSEAADEPEPEPEPEPVPEPFRIDRVAVVGASASAGFGLGKEVDGGASLADLLERAAPEAFGEVLDLADPFFFQNPDRSLERALVSVRTFAPDLIVGVDVQFWFGYGAKSMDLRVRHLRQCLTALEGVAEELDARVLVGDFPDVRDASFLFMPPDYEPDDATLAELNAVVRAWCEEHARFDLVPMGGFVDHLQAGEPIELRGRSFDTSDQAVWLQQDRLHPTLFGTAALALLALDVLERESGLVGPNATLEVEWEPAAVADALRTPAAVGTGD